MPSEFRPNPDYYTSFATSGRHVNDNLPEDGPSKAAGVVPEATPTSKSGICPNCGNQPTEVTDVIKCVNCSQTYNT